MLNFTVFVIYRHYRLSQSVADCAPDSGWSLEDYLEGLGPSRAADFLEELAAVIES